MAATTLDTSGEPVRIDLQQSATRIFPRQGETATAQQISALLDQLPGL
jgi:hypothetical protein